MSRFVTQNEVRLPLSHGDYVVVKERLNMGEDRDRTAAMLTDDRRAVDPLKYPLATVAAYLLDWSFTDDAGRIVAIRHAPPEDVAAILTNLDPADFREILAAIEAHEQRVTAAREEKKRMPTGATASAPSSPSLVAVDGGLSGSRN
jgi:hypothetical protein